jgi:uncharacterized protein
MRLLPRKATFFDLFDRHASTLVAMCRELREMIHSYDQLEVRQARIKDLEHQCDAITHELATELHRSFVTPLDKEDIAAIANGLDDIADFADGAAVRFILYKIPQSTPESRQLADLLLEAAGVLASAVGALRSGKERDKIIQACRELHRLENESDTIYQGALGELFNTPGVDPIAVMKWKEIYERLEMAVDQCEDVANVLESIQHKYA